MPQKKRKRGRPSTMTQQLALTAFHMLEFSVDNFGRMRWMTPMSVVARRCRITKSKLQRLLDSKVPPEIAPWPGARWKNFWAPALAYREAMRRGLV